MKFISVRDLRNQSGTLQRALAEDNITVTSNGKPFALMVAIPDGDDPAELERLIRKARAEWALSRIRGRARKNGLDRLTMDEIDSEIQASRAERNR
jgi:antitoxin (DNA-binding transcriptional repressor) of toxin-antitoxin stability system